MAQAKQSPNNAHASNSETFEDFRCEVGCEWLKYSYSFLGRASTHLSSDVLLIRSDIIILSAATCLETLKKSNFGVFITSPVPKSTSESFLSSPRLAPKRFAPSSQDLQLQSLEPLCVAHDCFYCMCCLFSIESLVMVSWWH